MTAPINRDDQIKLMVTTKERHDALVARWMKDETVLAALVRPAPGQRTTDGYARREAHHKLAKCG